MMNSMTSKMDARMQSNNPASHSECVRQNCRLRLIGRAGLEECLMESVRSKWSDTSAANYCKDPSCKKFVDIIQSKFESIKVAR